MRGPHHIRGPRPPQRHQNAVPTSASHADPALPVCQPNRPPNSCIAACRSSARPEKLHPIHESDCSSAGCSVSTHIRGHEGHGRWSGSPSHPQTHSRLSPGWIIRSPLSLANLMPKAPPPGSPLAHAPSERGPLHRLNRPLPLARQSRSLQLSPGHPQSHCLTGPGASACAPTQWKPRRDTL